jgi:hypothetical protein
LSRHAASRRRNYGKRQHELRQRRRQDTWRLELLDGDGSPDAPGPRNPATVFSFLNGRLSLEGNS